MLTPEELKQFGIDKASLERRYGTQPMKKTKEEENQEIVAITKGVCFLVGTSCFVAGSGVLFGWTGFGVALLVMAGVFLLGAFHNPKQ